MRSHDENIQQIYSQQESVNIDSDNNSDFDYQYDQELSSKIVYKRTFLDYIWWAFIAVVIWGVLGSIYTLFVFLQ